MIDGDQGCTMEIVRSEVGTEIGAMSEDRAVFHEPIAEKHFLAGNYIRLP